MIKQTREFDYAPFGGEAVFQAMPEAYLLLDPLLRVVLANDRYLATMQCSKDEVLGRSVYEINQYGSSAQRQARHQWLVSTFQQTALGKSFVSPPFSYDMPQQHQSGENALATRSWVVKTSVLLSQDDLPFTLVRVDEVTESIAEAEASRREVAQLRSQAQLRRLMVRDAEANYLESQARFSMALEFAKIGAWDLDIATGAFACTDQCKVNVGLLPSASITERMFFQALVDPEDRTRLEDTMNGALLNFLPFECDYRRTWPDGAVHWLLMKGSGRYDDNGELLTIMGFTLDITERKEAEINQVNIAMGERLARQQSDSTAKAMDHFVTAVSHELRSPLNAILSWATLLRRAKDTNSVDRGANVIERNARQLTHMVEDLLDSGAIVTGKLSVKRELIDLGAIAGNILEDIRPMAQAKGLQLKALGLDACSVLGDESRLKQVVWNLLTNAVKYSAAGEISLEVRREPGAAVLVVKDSGCGIDASMLGQIFERFSQATNDNAGRVGGLGLGLWLVKSIVDLHDGHVAVDSEGVGKGATFKVTLPSIDRIL